MSVLYLINIIVEICIDKIKRVVDIDLLKYFCF